MEIAMVVSVFDGGAVVGGSYSMLYSVTAVVPFPQSQFHAHSQCRGRSRSHCQTHSAKHDDVTALMIRSRGERPDRYPSAMAKVLTPAWLDDWIMDTN